MGLKNKIEKIKIMRNKDTGNAFVRYRKSFFHAVDGIKYNILFEKNTIIMIIGAILTIIFGFLLRISIYEWLFCVAIIGAIIATELLNSAIEALVDLVTKEKHPLAKISKDTASGAVLILCIAAFIGACIIFIPKIIQLFRL